MLHKSLLNCLSIVGALTISAVAIASDWKSYDASAYGFSMLVPTGVNVRERESGGGWGGMYAEFEGVKLYGLAKLGSKESDDDIEKFALRVIGIPASAWTRIDKGTSQNGWARYSTFRANSGGKLVFGGYGVGAKGNYLMYLETTAGDYADHKAEYEKWYESIRLY